MFLWTQTVLIPCDVSVYREDPLNTPDTLQTKFTATWFPPLMPRTTVWAPSSSSTNLFQKTESLNSQFHFLPQLYASLFCIVTSSRSLGCLASQNVHGPSFCWHHQKLVRRTKHSDHRNQNLYFHNFPSDSCMLKLEKDQLWLWSTENFRWSGTRQGSHQRYERTVWCVKLLGIVMCGSEQDRHGQPSL